MKIKWMPGITVPFFKIFYCRCLNCCAHIQPLLRVSVPATCSITFRVFNTFTWRCNNCHRKQLSKGLLSNETVVKEDICPRTLLFKEAFTSEKLFQLIFFLHIWNIIWMCYIMRKNIVNSLRFVELISWPKVWNENSAMDKCLLGQLSPWKNHPWTNYGNAHLLWPSWVSVSHRCI